MFKFSFGLATRKRAFSLAIVFLILSSISLAPKAGASTLVQRGYVLISSNSGFTAANGVTGGSGTSTNPYVISGWDIISSSPNFACVEIANTTAYFSVVNTRANCPNYNNYAYSSIALVLQNVSNGKIASSYFAGNNKAATIASSTNLILSNSTFAGGVSGGLTLSAVTNATLIANGINGNVGITNSQNVSVSGGSISGDPFCGSPPCDEGPTLYVSHSSTVTISNNVLTGAYIEGVLSLTYISGLQILNNNAHCNICYAISVDHANNTLISENTVSGGGTAYGYKNWDQGIVLIGPINSAQVTANNITQEAVGIRLQGTASVSVYHNNLLNNTAQASDDNPGKNQWDNGYPSGGNFWSDYTGVDRCGGPNQNICPFRDGIGDTPYTFNYAQDRFPLIGPFESVSASFAVHGSITIVGDGGFTSSNGVTRGTGTDRDPYVISSWSITGNSVYISVSNTTAFFVIQNVVLKGAYGGITLSNVTNGAVDNSHVYEYQTYAGINVKASKDIRVAYDSSSAGGCGPNEGCGGDAIVILNSVNVIVAHNSLPGTQGENLQIANSNNVTVTENTIGESTSYGMHVLNSRNVTISGNSFEATSLEISYPAPGEDPYKITTDNLVNGKPLYYYDDCSNGGLSLDHVTMGQLIIFNCSNVRLSNLIVTGTDIGITMNHVQRALIDNINASADRMEGLHLTESSNVVIMDSDFSLVPFSFGNLYPFQLGILVQQSNDTSVYGSRFYNDPIGMMLQSSFNATISGNTFPSDYTMICLQSSTGIHIFHNDFFGNGGYYCTSDIEPGHFWDNGYPSGGNYWSSYTGADPDSDGVGDTPQPVTGGVYQDNYPLMKPFVADPLITVVVGTDGNVYSSTSRSDGVWKAWQSLSGSTPSTPTVCRSGPDRVELVVRGMDNGIYHKSNVNGTWSNGWESLGGLTPDQPACAVLGGILYVVVRGMTNDLYYQTVDLQTDTKSDWIYLSGSSPSAPAVCDSGPSSLELVVKGDDSAIYHKSFSAGTWSAAWDKNPNGVTIDSPVCAVVGSTLYIVVTGATAELWSTMFDLSSRTWAASWTDLQGFTPSMPELVSTTSVARLDLVVRGMDDTIYHKSLVNGVWSPAWDALNGATEYPVATTSDGRDLRIVVVAMDGSLVSNMLSLSSSSWSGWTSMNGATNAAPSSG